MKKIVIILLLITGISFQNCEPCDPPEPPPYFDIKEFSLTHLITKGFHSRPLNANESLEFTDYHGFLINFSVDYISNHRNESHSSFSTIPFLNACSPYDPGYKGAKSEKIESIKVTTIFPYDSLHLAGAEMNDILYLRDERMFLDSFIQKNQDQLIPYDRMYLDIVKRPDLFIIWKGDFQLKTKIVLSNGEQYESLSDAIRFIL